MKGRRLTVLPAAHSEHCFGVQRAFHAAVQHGASGLAGGGKIGARHAAPQGHHAGAKNFQRPFHGQADGLAAVGQQVARLSFEDHSVKRNNVYNSFQQPLTKTVLL